MEVLQALQVLTNAVRELRLTHDERVLVIQAGNILEEYIPKTIEKHEELVDEAVSEDTATE